jgi:hypothetical protein
MTQGGEVRLDGDSRRVLVDEEQEEGVCHLWWDAGGVDCGQVLDCLAERVGDDEMVVIGGHCQVHSKPKEVKLGASNLFVTDHSCTEEDVEQLKELSRTVVLQESLASMVGGAGFECTSCCRTAEEDVHQKRIVQRTGSG